MSDYSETMYGLLLERHDDVIGEVSEEKRGLASVINHCKYYLKREARKGNREVARDALIAEIYKI